MFEALVKDTLETMISGGWVAFAAFGTYLAYKLAVMSVISYSALKIVGKIVDRVSQGSSNQRLLQLIAAAGMEYPLSEDEWKELNKRVKP